MRSPRNRASRPLKQTPSTDARCTMSTTSTTLLRAASAARSDGNAARPSGLSAQRFAQAAASLTSVIVTVTLLTIMALTTADVIGRYFLSKPVPGALEITELLLASLIFMALPQVTLRREHVTIDLLDGLFKSRWLRTVQRVIVAVMVALCCGFLGYRMWLQAENIRAAGETTATLGIVVYPVAYGLSVLLMLSAVAALANAFSDAEDSSDSEGVSYV
ncbi:TRAP transporter small permease (plasmid) [Hydrogenophaga sp. PBL-H3]|nr:TRAP transporter small permease [Hydrogenophaga sp. PBL-H3]QHE83086.1 TRAP transporter small permease [Hydrogenophaga sp. PBL-H3]